MDAEQKTRTAVVPPLRGRELLRTRRLCLRELGTGDVFDLLRLDRSERVHRLLLDDHAKTLEHSLALVWWAQQFYREHPGLGIWAAHDGQRGFVGIFSLMPLAGQRRVVEIGARLLPASWGRGYPAEGGEALCRHAFDQLGLERVFGLFDPANRGARLAMQRLGFVEDGCTEHFGKAAQRYLMTPEHWQARQQRHDQRLRSTQRERSADAAPAEAGPAAASATAAGGSPRFQAPTIAPSRSRA